MEETRFTFCRMCEATCGLKAVVDDGQVVSLEPDRDHVASRGYACAKGLRSHEVLSSPDRLTVPLRRTSSGHSPLSWRRALREIGRSVRRIRAEHGPDAVALYLGNPVSFSFLPPVLASGFLQGLGSRSLYQTGSQDCNNKFAVAERMYGFPFLQPFPDVDSTSCLVLVGSNPAVSRMSFVQLPRPIERLRAIEERGGRVYHVNPRRTETAERVGEHLFIRPGTDVFFYLSFLREVLERGGVDDERVRMHMSGLDELRAVASPWPAERTAAVTCVSAEDLRRIVAAYLEAEGAALYCSTGVNQGGQGTLAFWLQEAINAISGNLDRRGGTLVGRGFAPEFFPVAKEAGHTLRVDRSRVGGIPSVVDSFSAGLLADEILTPGPGQVRALVVLGGNPLLTVPNPDGGLERALRQLDLLVCVDVFRNETGELAHFLLPGTSPLQRPDLPFVFQSLMGAQPIPYAQFTEAVAPLEGEQRDETDIIVDLARACGVGPFGSPLAGAFLGAARAARQLPVLGRRLEPTPRLLLALASIGLGLGPLTQLARDVHGRRLPDPVGDDFLGARVLTDDGRVQLAPADLVEAARGLDALFEREAASLGTFKLISKREQHTLNSWLHNLPGFADGDRSTNYVYLHPDDGGELGAADGDLVAVRSEAGEIVLPCRLSDAVMPRSVAVPHGWGHGDATGLSVASRAPGANANLLSPGGPASLDPLSGMTLLTAIPVQVRRAD